MKKYKLTIYFIDNTYSFMDYDSDKNYDNEFEKMKKCINDYNWFNIADKEKNQSINTNNIKYWTLEKVR